MITLNCTKCQATLEMDDAFAGGVCRCQHCGTIQTVPSHLKQPSSARGAAGAGARATAGRALYSTKSATGAGLPNSGLDELATVVASSGLSSGLSNRRPTPTADYATPAAAKPASRLPLLVGGGALVAALLGVIAYLMVSRPTSAPPSPAQQQTAAPAGPGDPTPTRGQSGGKPAVSGPHFLGQPLPDRKIVYLLDRSQSNQEVLDPLMAAVYESLETLGADRDFQVIFWTRSAGPDDKPDVNEFAYPKAGTAKANPDRIKECRRAFEDLTTTGRTDLGPALQEAVRRSPDAIVVATAKGFNLDETVVQQAEKARAGKLVKVHTIDLSTDGTGRAVLEAIANKAGGTYRHVPPTQLGGE